MAEHSKRITIEEGRIIIESTDKRWLDFIKAEILKSELSPEPSHNSSEARVKKFVGYCWERSRMRNVIRTLARNRKVPYETIEANYKGVFGKDAKLQGVMSGFSRNARKAGLAKNWLETEHNGTHWDYAINDMYYSLIRAEVSGKEKK